MADFESDAVRSAFDAFPAEARQPLLQIRDLIFEVAAETPGVGCTARPHQRQIRRLSRFRHGLGNFFAWEKN